jgi:hypothetical protein
MLAETIQTVHTTGINWGSVTAIFGSFVAAVSVLLGYVGKRANKRDAIHAQETALMRADFQKGLRDLGNVLSLKLETKEAVYALDRRVTRLEATRDTRDVVR